MKEKPSLAARLKLTLASKDVEGENNSVNSNNAAYREVAGNASAVLT